jgi:GNAT superfamily N-acetyltransferase
MPTVIRKCQSKKHLQGGCGDPKCPEGLSLQVALEDALANNDISAYLDAKGKLHEKPKYVSKVNGWVEMDFGKVQGHPVLAIVEPNRPEVKAAIAKLDKNEILSFHTLKRLESYFDHRYGGAATVKLDIREDKGHGWKELHVVNLNVDADLRGLGIGTQIRRTLIRHADEHGYILGGTPTSSGDGSKRRTEAYDPELDQHVAAHQERLRKFYVKHGYIRNPCTRDYQIQDTDEAKTYRETESAKLTEDAQKWFRNRDASYIKLPNGEYPTGMKLTGTINYSF